MFAISPDFLFYLNDTAPSALYLAPVRMISFRWKIPRDELLLGKWTSPMSGIDPIAELHTKELCGFVGLHFPGHYLMRRLAAQSPGPYTAVQMIESLQEVLLEHEQTLGTHYDRFREEARSASDSRCLLRCTLGRKPPIVLTREIILANQLTS